MKSSKHKIRATIFSLILCHTVFAQGGDVLRVGDPTPALKVYDWIKGEPVPSLKKGRIYVVEFGATWCKPCFKAIPELKPSNPHRIIG